jgi:hypothetical protein
MQAVPERNRLADPMAERRVIGTCEDSVNGQAIWGSTHAGSIPDRLRGWSIRPPALRPAGIVADLPQAGSMP